jgi:RES domain-containing protein
LVGWDAEPAGRASMQWGSAWARAHASSSLLAVVPSIVVPEEMNALINPAHRGLGQLKATKVRKWLYDRRLED